MTRIAMWSGPRNLSTAMMYSFGSRVDCDVMDEPFYAAYLAQSGVDHPMRAEILTSHEQSPDAVVAQMIADREVPYVYMKHMPHHMLDGFPMGWAAECVNVHLIRHPARVISSYAAKWNDLTLEQIGFAQQVALYDRLGGIVINSFDIRQNPEKALRGLCEAIGMPFDPAMLHWPAGPRAEDGVWAAHWYGAVHRSTGFAGAEGKLPLLEPELQALCDQALPFYEAMAARKI